jgi:hypothetical protein
MVNWVKWEAYCSISEHGKFAVGNGFSVFKSGAWRRFLHSWLHCFQEDLPYHYLEMGGASGLMFEPFEHWHQTFTQRFVLMNFTEPRCHCSQICVLEFDWPQFGKNRVEELIYILLEACRLFPYYHCSISIQFSSPSHFSVAKWTI